MYFYSTLLLKEKCNPIPSSKESTKTKEEHSNIIIPKIIFERLKA